MQKYVIALYIRLSIEDYKYDSLSIENQSLVLHEYAASMPEALNAEIMEFIDNGYSGTNFERPQVQKLIELVRANQIDCICILGPCTSGCEYVFVMSVKNKKATDKADL